MNGFLYLGSMIAAGLVGLSLLLGIVALAVTFFPSRSAVNDATGIPREQIESSSAASRGKLP